MRVSAVGQAWEAIELALDEATVRALRPPVSAARLAKAREVLGPLPASMRALLAHHDGMRDAPLFLNVRLLPLDQIIKTWRMRLQSSESDSYEWSRGWIPLTDADGDHVCLDKKTGRVIGFTNAGARARVIAPTLLTWLRRLPGYIRAERNEERRRAALLPSSGAGASKRERERTQKVDGELGFFVGFIEHLERVWDGKVPVARALGYRPVARVRAQEVLDRSLELGHVARVPEGFRTTPKGRRFRAG
jgi:cell wall assembly regulator SMI1